MRLLPRIGAAHVDGAATVGRRLQTLAVKAGKRCSGSPNLSRRQRLHMVFEVGRSRRSRARLRRCRAGSAPSTSARVRDSAYSQRHPAPCRTGCWRAGSASRAPCTLKTVRICRWSCRFSPTPGSSCATSMPCRASSVGVADAGELQQLRRVDRAGGEDHLAPCRGASCSGPRADSDAGGAPALEQRAARPARRSDAQVRAGARTGAGTPSAAFQRTPRRWLTSK